MRVQPTSSFLI